ncbi:glycosyltransferase [Selenomonas sp. AE3005]|uniref:glycosyltransferase family 2 protein n=1 Tax=Selenomonas sp. AE3005 TaxID=1485543 RepID=UPI000480A8B6|nr:glycosyltransferase [Selenomonas sp. AE3005]
MDIVTYDKYDFFNRDDHFTKYRNVKSLLLHGKKNAKAEISIVIPVYKRVEFIREAIESALNQNTKHVYNIIVVDNTAENDDIYDIVKSYPEDKVMYYKNEKNIGMFGNFNRCIEVADSPWIAILHDDDKMKPDYVENILNVTKINSDCVAIGVEHELINAESEVTDVGLYDGKVKKLSMIDFYFKTCPVSIAGFAFRKNEAMAMGGFDEDYYPAADANFMCKLQAGYGYVYRLGKTLMQYRIAANESMNPQTLRQFLLYNYEQNKAVSNRVNRVFKLFYHMHQNAFIHDGMNSCKLFNVDVDYRDIKDVLNYKNSLSVFFYRNILKFIRPYLWVRIIKKIKKLGGAYK